MRTPFNISAVSFRRLILSSILILIFFSIDSGLYAADNSDGGTDRRGISLSITPYVSAAFGKHGERLYYSNSGNQCSYLEWEEMHVFSPGVSAQLKLGGFGISALADFAVPSDCGNMYDSDWIYTDEYPDGLKTTYSIHDAECTFKVNTQISLSYDIDLGSRFTLTPQVQAQYSYIEIEARNGYGWYGTSAYSLNGETVAWNSGDAKYYPRLYGIDFRRHSFFTWTGLSASARIFRGFTAGIGVFVSPFAYSHTHDHHLSSDGGYNMKNYIYHYFSRVKFEADASYRFSRLCSFDLGLTLTAGKTDKDNLYTDYYTGKLLKSSQKAGSDFFMFAVKAGCTFYIEN